MSMELSTVRSSLTTLSSSLNLEPDIKRSIDQMISKVRECLNRYESTLIKEGGAILVQKDLILASKSPGDLKVQGMQTALHEISSKMRAVRDASLALQTDVHSNIESCRGRKQTHESTIVTDQQTLNAIAAEIQGINAQIATFDADIVRMNNDAATLETRAGEIDRARQKKKKNGVLGVVASIAGIALAPFTGGLSPRSYGSGRHLCGVNFDDAEDCRRSARDLHASAQIRRNDAQKLRDQNTAAASRKSGHEQQIQSLQSKTVQLESTILTLQQMTLSLTNLVKDIDMALNVFQNALKKHPEHLAVKAKAMLEELQGKWTNIETMLVASGARAILVHESRVEL